MLQRVQVISVAEYFVPLPIILHPTYKFPKVDRSNIHIYKHDEALSKHAYQQSSDSTYENDKPTHGMPTISLFGATQNPQCLKSQKLILFTIARNSKANTSHMLPNSKWNHMHQLHNRVK